MPIGNCLAFAFMMKYRKGAKIMRVRKVGHCPHYFCKLGKGNIVHFKLVRDILPFPLCYFLFVGKPTKLGKGGIAMLYRDYLNDGIGA